MDKSRIIMMGDANAIAQMWCPIERLVKFRQDNTNTNYIRERITRGRILENFISKNKLSCLNDIKQGPTFKNSAQGNDSYIDIALVGNKTHRTWNRFQIAKTGPASGHKMIIIRPYTN